MRRYLSLLLLALLLGGCSSGAKTPVAKRSPTPLSSNSSATPITVLPSPSAPLGVVPMLLIIKSINLSASVESRGLDANNNLAIPSSDKTVAWYTGSVLPGSNGNAIINGHLDSYSGDAVFISLDKVGIGESVIVQGRDGRSLTFKVMEKKIYPYNAHPLELFSHNGPPRLSLITCTGRWNPIIGQYSERLVVNAELFN